MTEQKPDAELAPEDPQGHQMLLMELAQKHALILANHHKMLNYMGMALQEILERLDKIEQHNAPLLVPNKKLIVP